MILHLSWPDKRSWRQCNCQRFLQCIYQQCLHWQNCPIHYCVPLFERGSNVHNNPSRNFSISQAEHSHWNPWTSSAGNVLGFWQVYWGRRLQENYPKAQLYDSEEIFTSCWPDQRRLKLSPLQSLPTCSSLRAKVCQGTHSWKKHHSWWRSCKFTRRLSFKQNIPMKPDEFGSKLWLLAEANTYHVPHKESDKQWAISKKTSRFLCCLDYWRALLG